MKILRMNELNGSSICTAKRNFHFLTKERESEVYQKAVVTKQIIKEYYAKKIKREDLETVVRERMESISFLSDEQRDVQTMDILRQIRRYIDSEKRTPIVAPPATISISSDTSVIVSPDYLFINENELEVVKIRCGKPSLTSKNAPSDLGLYSMLCYAAELAKTKSTPKIECVKASYYFLGKQNDSFSTEKPNFDADFFNNIGGRNIISLSDTLSLTVSSATIAPVIRTLEAGIKQEDCSKSDCEYCDLHDICKYAEPPIAIEKEPVTKTARLTTLTPSQQMAINYEKGICRINAGAGAGKTLVVALRTANLIMKGVDPKEICLITFTNSGAEEMRSRIKIYLDEFELSDIDISDMTIQTFNAFGDEIIRTNYKKLGFTQPPTLIDDTERSNIIAELINKAVKEPRYAEDGTKIRNPLKDLNWRQFTSNNFYSHGAITVVRKVFDIMKAEEYSAADVTSIRVKLGTEFSRFIGSIQCLKEIAMLYDKYDEMLRQENLIEYADQEAMVFELLHQDPYYFEQYGFRHIFIDEFQDSNLRQIEMAKLMVDCPTFESLMVVGDDSQSIYAFRGTTNEYIVNFEQYIGAEIDDIYLLENHRSTPEIIDFANKINAKNTIKVDKDLIATRPSGKPVVVQGFFTKDEEYNFVINSIKQHLTDGIKPEQIAIECYTRQELLEMANRLSKEGIASVLMNPELLVENSRVRAAISFANALMDESSTKDVLVYANADIGGGMMTMSEQEISEQVSKVTDLIHIYHSLDDDDYKKQFLMECLYKIDHYNDEVYNSFLDKLKTKHLSKILDYLNKFYLYGSTSAIRRTHNYPGVVLTTAHSAKGLEWNVVYNMISKYDAKELPDRTSAIEERRRLLFVSSTRARDELYITAQYISKGKRGAYECNRFLVEAYQAVGMTMSPSAVFQEKEMREKEKKSKEKQNKQNKKTA